MANTNLNIRIDVELKQKSEEILNELGLNMTTALTIFLRQIIRSKGIPFEMRLDTHDNETTLQDN